MPEDLVNVPPDLTLLSDGDLQTLEARVLAEFDRLNEPDDVSPEAMETMLRFADDIDRIKAEITGRDERRKEATKRAQQRTSDERQALLTRMHGPAESESNNSEDESGGSAPIDLEAIVTASAKGTATALAAMLGDRATGRDLVKATERATATLADARRLAPEITLPKPKLAVVASVDIPGVATGADLPTLDAVVDAFQKRVRGLPVTDNGRPDAGPRVVTIRNEFEHTIDDRTSPSQVEELFNHLTSKDKQEALVAGGGWCAPSEIRYDFFNIACEDGLIDLPTFGVSRGGVRFPVSPSLADVFGTAPNQAFGGFSVAFTNQSNPWLWTETDDQATVTGTPNKPCIRVPCPTFDERRLECYGICLTAGNLTDDAYPEATANFLRLLMSAHSHAMNQRFINTMVALSSPVVSGGGFGSADRPAYQQTLSGIELASVDYRARYGMCETDVLEVVVPQWLKSVLRADLAHRTGVDLLSVTNAQLISFFADRGVRVQFVNDWQVRGSGQFGASTPMTVWPETVDVLIFAAGTFLLGNGLTLDLGVVRDSVLNAENDHTAAWSEECHLIARIGHESRQYRISYDVVGKTGAANIATHGL